MKKASIQERTDNIANVNVIVKKTYNCSYFKLVTYATVTIYLTPTNKTISFASSTKTNLSPTPALSTWAFSTYSLSLALRRAPSCAWWKRPPCSSWSSRRGRSCCTPRSLAPRPLPPQPILRSISCPLFDGSSSWGSFLKNPIPLNR